MIDPIMPNEDFEDIEACAKVGRPPRASGPYRVKIGDEQLNFRDFVIADPVPTGRQILDSASLRPVEEFVLFQMLSNGLLEEVRLEETTDLRECGIEKFLAFRTDRIFRFILDSREFEWGAPLISGRTLKTLAEVDLATYGVWQEIRGPGDDKPISDAQMADLSPQGLEKFFTGATTTTEG